MFIDADCNQISVVYQRLVEDSLSETPFLPKNSRICILRLSAIGDVCHAVAMVQRILTHRPDIQITWIIGKVEYQLVKGMPRVNFVIYDKKTGRQGIKSIRNTLKGVRFEVLCIMQVALRANLLSRAINAKIRIGFDKNRSKEGHGLFINRRIEKQQHPHVLEGFMAFADALGIPQQKPQWKLPLAADDWQFGDDISTRFGRFAVIAPAASKAERNWSVEGYVQAAKYLHAQGVQVVLCGGPGILDKTIGSHIIASGAPIAENLIGKTTLKQLAGVLAKAEVVLAPDTGPAHMATCVNTPVVGLYAHSNPKRTGPYNSQNLIVSVYEDCIEAQYGKGWNALPWGKRAKGDALMNKINVEQVQVNLRKALQRHS